MTFQGVKCNPQDKLPVTILSVKNNDNYLLLSMINKEDCAREIPYEHAATVLENMTTWHCFDFGCMTIVFGSHYMEGPIAVITTMSGRAIVLYL